MEKKVIWLGEGILKSLCKNYRPHEPHPCEGFFCVGVKGEAFVQGCSVKLNIEPIQVEGRTAGYAVEYTTNAYGPRQFDRGCEELFVWLLRKGSYR